MTTAGDRSGSWAYLRTGRRACLTAGCQAAAATGRGGFSTAGRSAVATAGRRAFTLVEMLVVILIIAIMISLIVPASNAFVYSYKTSSAQNLIRSALAQAQAYAAKERRYAGIRFQYDADGWENGRQYLILVEKTPAEYDNPYQYQAVPNVTPVSLPAGMGVLSGVVSTLIPADGDDYLDDDITSANGPEFCLNGAATFTILFSPSGKLVGKMVEIHERNVDDKTFNSLPKVEASPPEALLSFDKHWDVTIGSMVYGYPWCVTESSVMSLVLFETGLMQQAPDDGRYSGYVAKLKPILINIHTGDLIQDQL